MGGAWHWTILAGAEIRMNRRDMLRGLASVVRLRSYDSLRGQGSVRYEVYGAGPTLIIGAPITASSAESLRTGYIDRLTDRYRVILMHYPSVRRRHVVTPDRVSDDMLT